MHEALGRGDRHAAPITDAERALLAMVEKWTFHAYRTTPEDMDGLRAHGYNDGQIAEAVYITALFAFFNRVADAFGLPDPDYFNGPTALAQRKDRAMGPANS